MSSVLSCVLPGRWKLDMRLRRSKASVAIEILQKYKAPHAFRSQLERHRYCAAQKTSKEAPKSVLYEHILGF